MDFTLIVGVLVGVVLILWGIVFGGGKLIYFYDFASVLITVGGTLSSVLASFPFKDFKNLPKHVLIAVKKQKYSPAFYINTIVEFAYEARKNGILSLEEKAAGIKDKFLASSIMLIVDALDPDKTRELIESEIGNLEARHANVWKMYDKASTFAPAFGMIGTLIGLITMLANLDMDSESGASALTKGMAVSLITTFYGSVLANVVFMPIGNKLRARHDDEILCKMIIAEGVMAIQAGDNPRFIEQKLNSFLDTKARNKKDKKAKKSDDAEENKNG